MSAEERLYRDLDAAGIAYGVHEHPAVFTVEQSQAIKTDIASFGPCLHTKNLFLKDAGGSFFLLTVPAEARINLKRVHPLLPSRRLSFGKPDAMEHLIGVTPGSVTPLAMINAEAGAITLVLDQRLAVEEAVGVHPLRNTATLTLKGTDVLAVARSWGHDPRVVDLPKIPAD
ncbi:MAG: prolyl-tRNA synthetase associated domain-containing protein [Pseudomonadota bacterium]